MLLGVVAALASVAGVAASPLKLEAQRHHGRHAPTVHATLCMDPYEPAAHTAVLLPGSGLMCPGHSRPVATGTYADTIHEIGWGEFSVTTSDRGFSDYLLAFGAGYVEGHLTAHRIEQQIANYRLNVFKNSDATPPPKTRQFLDDQLNWARSHSEDRWRTLEAQRLDNDEEEMSNEEKYWRTVHVVIAQFDGIVHGYASTMGIPIQEAHDGLSWINSNNEIDELMHTVFNETDKDESKQSNEELSMLSCSAFISVLPGNEDVLLAHDTWRGYFGMLRIFKYYKLELSYTTSVVGFSSAAGTTSSHDDFYITSSNLAIAETTNSQFNKSWVQLNAKPESLVVWQRSNIANILATTGREWADIFAKENSGLYPNQWMIVDYNLFEPGMEELPDNLLTISEQLPDRCVTGDGTPRLRKESFWPSYNIPYFKEVYELSGYPDVVAKRGEDFSYEGCPRAHIFARERSNVKTMDDAMSLIRLNDWQTDPFSKGGAHNAISSRYDMAPEPKAFGGVDGKITSKKLMQTLSAMAQSGPTTQNQVPFSWSHSNYSNSVYRFGLPDTYDFPWVRMDAPFPF